MSHFVAFPFRPRPGQHHYPNRFIRSGIFNPMALFAQPMLRLVHSSILYLHLFSFLPIVKPSTADRSPIQSRPIIVIGLDGLGSDYLEAPGIEEIAPELYSIFRDGAHNMNGMAVMPAMSMANWATLLLGTNTSTTGITSNDFKGAEEITHLCTSLIDAVRGNGLPTLTLASWMPMDILTPLDARGQAIDDLVNYLIGFVKNGNLGQGLAFLHVDDIDHAGHRAGFGSLEYGEALRRVDQVVIGAVKQVAMEVGAIIMVVADHYGHGKEHGSQSDRRVPLMVWSPNPSDIRQGHCPQLTDLTAVSSTILHIKGIMQPAHWTGMSAAQNIFTTVLPIQVVEGEGIGTRRCRDLQSAPRKSLPDQVLNFNSNEVLNFNSNQVEQVMDRALHI